MKGLRTIASKFTLFLILLALMFTGRLSAQETVDVNNPFFIKLGSFKYDTSARYVETQERNGSLYNIWEYKVTFNKPNNYGISLANNFVTTLDSGHEAPNITKITTSSGVSLSTGTTNTSNGNLMNAKRHGLDVNTRGVNASETRTETVTYTVETKVRDYRSYYPINFYTEAKVNIPAGVTVSDGTNTIVTNKPIELTNSKFVRSTPNVEFATNDKLANYVINETSPFIVSNKIGDMYVAGEYHAGNPRQIQWSVTVPNNDNKLSGDTSKNVDIPLNFDASQTKSSAKLYMYRPSPTGYVLNSTQDFNGGNVTIPKDYIAQVVLFTTVSDEKVPHSFLGAKLDSLKSELKIKKEWREGSKPVDVTFKVKSDNGLDKTINYPANQSEVVVSNSGNNTLFDKYVYKNSKFEEVKYDVTEEVPPGTKQVFSYRDSDTLTYNFINQTGTVDNTSEPTPPGQCKPYGVISISDLRIYEYYTSNGIHGHGGKLSGRFRIPANAKRGDYFDLKLPNEIYVERQPDPKKVFFDIIANNKKIGETVVLDKRTIRFYLNDNAYSETDYEGTFNIGHDNAQRNVTRVDGRPSGGPVPGGIVPDRNYLSNGRPTISKQVSATSTYNGDIGDCNPVTTPKFNASTSYQDQEIPKYGFIRKESVAFGPDYIEYEILLNAAGKYRGDRISFGEFFTDTIAPYTGNYNQDIQVYKVRPIPFSFGYDPNSLQRVYPSMNDVRPFKPSNLRNYSGNITRIIEMNFTGFNSNTYLVKVKARKVSKRDNKWFNFFYPDDKGQNQATNGEYSSVGREDYETVGSANAEFFDNNRSKVKLVKVDAAGQKEPIRGNAAVFEIFKDNNGRPGDKIGTQKTNADGEIVFDLPNPTNNNSNLIFHILEKTPPAGYQKSDVDMRVRISKDRRGSVTIDYAPAGNNQWTRYDGRIGLKYENKKGESYRLRIKKLDENKSALRGAIFKLESLDSSNSYSVTTADNINVDIFEFAGLQKGRYRLTEVKSPSGYIGIDPIELEITENGATKLTDTNNVSATAITKDNNLYILGVTNKKKSNIKLKKVEYGNEAKTIAGVKFHLFKKDSTSGSLGSKVGEYTTARGGILEINNIDSGEYYIKEVEVPTLSGNKGYEVNPKYYKLIVSAGKVSIGDSALININGVYRPTSVDDKFIFGDFSDNTNNLIFKNEIKYRVSFEKNLYTKTNQPRLGDIRFSIKKADLTTESPVIEKHENMEAEIVSDDSSNGGPIVWEFKVKSGSNPHLWNPIFSVKPGKYKVEEVNAPEGYDKVSFEFTVAADGKISIDGFKDNNGNSIENGLGFDKEGNILKLRPTGYNRTNATLIHIFNKKPMEFYVNKINSSNNQIKTGTLKLKLEGVANLAGTNFTSENKKTLEFTFDLSKDIVAGKGLKIDVPRDLPSGKYKLTETSAPRGYIKSKTVYEIEINQENRTVKLLGEGAKTLYSEVFDRNNNSAISTTNSMSIVNEQQEYPLTGGLGPIVYFIEGGVLMLISAYFINRRRKLSSDN